MSERLEIYNNAGATTTVITFDAEVAYDIVSGEDAAPTGQTDVYIKLTPRGRVRDTAGGTITSKVIRSLDDLALTGDAYEQKQSWQNANTAYNTISESIEDYMFDFVNGHTAAQWGLTGLEAQLPIDFD